LLNKLCNFAIASKLLVNFAVTHHGKARQEKTARATKSGCGGGNGGGLAPPCHHTAFCLPFLSAFVGAQSATKKVSISPPFHTTIMIKVFKLLFHFYFPHSKINVCEMMSELCVKVAQNP